MRVGIPLRFGEHVPVPRKMILHNMVCPQRSDRTLEGYEGQAVDRRPRR